MTRPPNQDDDEDGERLREFAVADRTSAPAVRSQHVTGVEASSIRENWRAFPDGGRDSDSSVPPALDARTTQPPLVDLDASYGVSRAGAMDHLGGASATVPGTAAFQSAPPTGAGGIGASDEILGHRIPEEFSACQSLALGESQLLFQQHMEQQQAQLRQMQQYLMPPQEQQEQWQQVHFEQYKQGHNVYEPFAPRSRQGRPEEHRTMHELGLLNQEIRGRMDSQQSGGSYVNLPDRRELVRNDEGHALQPDGEVPTASGPVAPRLVDGSPQPLQGERELGDIHTLHSNVSQHMSNAQRFRPELGSATVSSMNDDIAMVTTQLPIGPGFNSALTAASVAIAPSSFHARLSHGGSVLSAANEEGGPKSVAGGQRHLVLSRPEYEMPSHTARAAPSVHQQCESIGDVQSCAVSAVGVRRTSSQGSAFARQSHDRSQRESAVGRGVSARIPSSGVPTRVPLTSQATKETCRTQKMAKAARHSVVPKMDDLAKCASEVYAEGNQSGGPMDQSHPSPVSSPVLRSPSLGGSMVSKPHRRKTVRWSPEEVEALLEGVRQQGVGKWAGILRASSAFADTRTSIDLKDKWRNISATTRSRVVAEASVRKRRGHADEDDDDKREDKSSAQSGDNGDDDEDQSGCSSRQGNRDEDGGDESDNDGRGGMYQGTSSGKGSGPASDVGGTADQQASGNDNGGDYGGGHGGGLDDGEREVWGAEERHSAWRSTCDLSWKGSYDPIFHHRVLAECSSPRCVRDGGKPGRGKADMLDEDYACSSAIPSLSIRRRAEHNRPISVPKGPIWEAVALRDCPTQEY